MRAALRERSIVVNSILIPVLLYPLLIWLLYTGMTFVSGQTEGVRSRVAIGVLPTGRQDLQGAIRNTPNIELVDSVDPAAGVAAGTIDAFVEFSMSGEKLTARIVYDSSRDGSALARTRVSNAISEYRDRFLEQDAVRRGITREEFQGFWVEEQNVSTGEEMGQFVLGLLLPMVLIVMLAVGGFHPAIDATAGERENSTWETLMTLATSRSNIVAAKYLYVATMSFVAGVLNVVAMTVSIQAILAPMGGSRSPISFRIPLQSLPVLILGAALLAFFIAAGMMILAAFARTFKEGQSMVSPFYVAIIMPITFIQGSAQEFTVGTAMIPVVNVAMMFREALVGTFDWPLIALTVAVEAVAVLVVLRLCMSILQYEDVLIGSYGGSFGKFVKERVFRR
jgi:sodium transport system permease protein